jgi:hypothetical protein
MDMKQLKASQLFLARLEGWGHQDGTAKVRVHVALATEGEWIYVSAGSSQLTSRAHQVVIAKDSTNQLIKSTAFVLGVNDCRWIHTSETLRVTGEITNDQLADMWDQLEAQ